MTKTEKSPNKNLLKTGATVGAMVLAIVGVSELQQHRNPYGNVQPSPNVAANINAGVNPADIISNNSGR